jgi:hypothetical protein
MSKAAEEAAWWAAFQSMLGTAGFGAVLLSLFFTGWAAYAASRAARAAEDSLKISRESSENQIRPYVHASAANFIWDGLGARVIVEVFNSGQTPAAYFEIGAVSRACQRGSSENIKIPTDLIYKRWTVLGGGKPKTVVIHDVTAEKPPDHFLIDARLTLDAKGQSNFFILGRIKYGDVFGNEYETEFSFFVNDTRPTNDQAGGRQMMAPPGSFHAFCMTKRAENQQPN